MEYNCLGCDGLDGREFARETNLGRVLEKKGREILGKKYRNPTESLPEFQRWSVEHPEVNFLLL